MDACEVTQDVGQEEEEGRTQPSSLKRKSVLNSRPSKKTTTAPQQDPATTSTKAESKPKVDEEVVLLCSKLYHTDPLVGEEMTYDQVSAYADAAIGQRQQQEDDVYYNPDGRSLASLPPPQPSLLGYISDAASRKLPKEGVLTKVDRRTYFSVPTAGSGSKTGKDASAAANETNISDIQQKKKNRTHKEAMKEKLMPRALYQTMDLSALVATGVAVEEILTSHLMPLARAYVAHCHDSSKNPSLPITSVASPGEALSNVFSSVKKRKLNDEKFWLPSTLPPTTKIMQLHGSKKATTNTTNLMDQKSVPYILTDRQGNVARQRWCKNHGYVSVADLKNDMRQIGPLLVPTPDEVKNSARNDTVNDADAESSSSTDENE
mmetsp:Transcript_27883/g.43278  ORF Transcript_27883/g.43278 Transcript_27883/m.43278 type:complete len:377 (-) Transcript_27883:1317-2447(-)